MASLVVYGGFRLIETLAQLLNIAITEVCVPSEWRKSYVVPLYIGILKWLAIIGEFPWQLCSQGVHKVANKTTRICGRTDINGGTRGVSCKQREDAQTRYSY